MSEGEGIFFILFNFFKYKNHGDISDIYLYHSYFVYAIKIRWVAGLGTCGIF